MNARVLLISMGVLLGAGQALAQADPDPDGIGLYFDLDATVNCAALEGPQVSSAYLLLTQASEPSGVSAFDCRIETPAWVFFVSVEFPAPALNIGILPDLIVGFATPLPQAPIIHLATLSFFVVMMDPAEIYLVPTSAPIVPGEIIYAAGNDVLQFIPMHPSTGGFEIPVAMYNGDCPVPAASSTWGGIKSIYR